MFGHTPTNTNNDLRAAPFCPKKKIYKAAATEDTSRTKHGKTPQDNKKIQTDLTQTQTNKTWAQNNNNNKKRHNRKTNGSRKIRGKTRPHCVWESVLRSVCVCVCDPVQVLKGHAETDTSSTICTCHSLSATEPQPGSNVCSAVEFRYSTWHHPKPAFFFLYFLRRQGVARDLGQWDIHRYIYGDSSCVSALGHRLAVSVFLPLEKVLVRHSLASLICVFCKLKALGSGSGWAKVRVRFRGRNINHNSLN